MQIQRHTITIHVGIVSYHQQQATFCNGTYLGRFFEFPTATSLIIPEERKAVSFIAALPLIETSFRQSSNRWSQAVSTRVEQPFSSRALKVGGLD